MKECLRAEELEGLSGGRVAAEPGILGTRSVVSRRAQKPMPWREAIGAIDYGHLPAMPFTLLRGLAGLCRVIGEPAKLPILDHRASDVREEWGLGQGGLLRWRARLLCGFYWL
jgi:hypothetical protein